jgi:hypothetical protein
MGSNLAEFGLSIVPIGRDVVDQFASRLVFCDSVFLW